MDTYTIRIPEDRGLKYDMFRYPAGEVQVRLVQKEIEELRIADEIRVVARITNGDIIELALLTDAIQHNLHFPTPMTLVLPYLPYSRADRRFMEGDCFGLKVFGDMINNLRYNQVVTIDAHSKVAKKAIHNLVDIDPFPLISKIVDIDPFPLISKVIGKSNPVILFPDKGAISRYHFADYKVLNCEKDRDPKTGKLLGFIVPKKEEFGDAKSVLIVDDICDGGGTFIGIADKLFQLRDWEIPLYLYVTHGIFSKGFEELNSRFRKIFTSDSYNFHTVDTSPIVKVLTTEQLINDAIGKDLTGQITEHTKILRG